VLESTGDHCNLTEETACRNIRFVGKVDAFIETSSLVVVNNLLPLVQYMAPVITSLWILVFVFGEESFVLSPAVKKFES
jgi:hypothetical protein